MKLEKSIHNNQTIGDPFAWACLL
uniref:Uncharacterized protein n=1 Tax=Anguilla anguilla TaxID=7936 RepID=A0A0E9R686_ANGAN